MAEHKVGSAADYLQNGEMKKVELEGAAVAVARVDGEYHAFAAECSHYHGPLNEGALCGHTVICPWHHACFDIRNGARLEAPALNGIASYPTRVEGGEVVVTLPETNNPEPGGGADDSDTRTFVIVGGGAAGSAAAEELRATGYKGKLIILSAAPDVPVDRPNLSKDYLAGNAQPEWVPLRGDASWYEERGIELRLNTKVTGISPRTNTVVVNGGESVRYDKLLLATGGTPRTLPNLPGGDAEGVFLLRELADCDRIIAAAKEGSKAIVIGSSFIAMEVAASLVGGRKVDVSIVSIDKVPFAHVFGPEIGALFQKEHEANGVLFHLSSEIARIVTEGGKATGVELKGGVTLPADFVVMGVGVRPATDFLEGSGLALNPRDGSVQVDAALRTSNPEIYAAGDIARWSAGSGNGTRIEHWRVAQQHGIMAALNMLGGEENVEDRVPFFWTTQWELNMGYCGHATEWDDIVIRGNLDEKHFIAFYLKDGNLLAAAANWDDRNLIAAELILQKKLPVTPDQLRDDNFDLVAYAGAS